MKVYADRITVVVLAAAVILACLIGLLIYLGFIADVPPDEWLNARKAVLFVLLLALLLTPTKPQIHPQNPYSF